LNPNDAIGDGSGLDTLIGEAPTVVIVSPNEGQVIQVGELVTLSGTVSDDTDPPDSLTIAWSSSLNGIIDNVPANAGGSVTFETSTLAPGNHQITLSATDSHAQTASVSVTLIVNTTPGAPGVQIQPEQPTSSDDLSAVVIADAQDLNRESSELVYYYQWFRDGEEVGLTSVDVPAHMTIRGESWQVRVQAHDGYGSGPEGIAAVVIGNSPPVCNNAILLPTAAPTNSPFTCKCIGREDADPDDEAHDTCVFHDGLKVIENPEGASDSCVLDSSVTSKGMAIVCTLTPSDGMDPGENIQTEPAQVLNSPPSAPGVQLSPEQGSVETYFSCSLMFQSTDIDSDGITYQYTWVVNGYENPGSTTTSIQAKQLVSDVDGTLAQGADAVVCRVRSYDGQQTSPPSDSNEVVLGNTPPSAGNVLVGPFGATELDEIVCNATGAVDPDGDPLTWQYEWYVNDIQVAGETGPTLTGEHFDKADQVFCKAAAFDGTDTGPMVAAKNSVEVANTPPSIEKALLSPEEVDRSGTLSCAFEGWDDPDPADSPSALFAWYVVADDGSLTEVEGAASADLSAASLTPGNKILCSVTPVDVDSEGDAVESNTATVINSAPSIQDVQLGPADALTDSILQCTPIGWSDIDGDLAGYQFQWLVNGSTVAGQTEGTLSGEHFAKGMQVVCAATPYDGYEQGLVVYSNPVIIGNSPPLALSLLLTPPTGGQQTLFQCAPQGVVDPDEDNVVFTFRWTMNGTLIEGLSSATVQGISFASGDKLRCEVTPFDGVEYGPELSSNIVSLFNNPPSIDTVTVEPLDPTTNAVLTCTPSGWFDPEGDPPDYVFQWYVNAQPLAGQTTPTLAGDLFSKGEQVSCRATPGDGLAQGAPLLSLPVTILNSMPTFAGASINPQTGNKQTEFTCMPFGWSDADDDSETAHYLWFLDGQSIEGQAQATITPVMMQPGQTLTCQVTPFDGESEGAPVQTDPVLLINHAPSIGSVNLGPEPAYTSSTVVCSPQGWSDTDGDLPGYFYEWLVNAQPIQGETGATLAGTFFSKKQKVYCNVTPFDGEKSGNPALSNPVTIANSPPKISSVDLTPQFGNKYGVYTCAANGVVDADSDPIQFQTEWLLNGAIVDGASDTTFQSNGMAPGDVLRCRVSPYDGENTGTPVQSATTFIINNPPSFTGAVIEPDTLYGDVTVTCMAQGWFDVDDEPMQATYAWFVNGVVVSGETSQTLSSAQISSGDMVSCTATPFDDYDVGASVLSSSVPVMNSVPSIQSVGITPAGGTILTGFDCHWSGFSDVDSDADESTLQWTVNGNPSGGTATSLSDDSYVKGDTIGCVVTPYDGTDNGLLVAAETVVVQNALPSIGDAQLTPVTGGKLDTFSCAAMGATDPDGDDITVFTAWFINDTEVPGQTGPTWVPSDLVIPGDAVHCRVQPFDGTATGPSVQSDTSSIINILPSLDSAGILPQVANTTTDVACVPQGWADADGDPEQVNFVWARNGVLLTGQTTATLASELFVKGDTVYCTATPFDAYGLGPSVTSPTLLIQNTPPVLSSATVDPPTGNRYTEFSCLEGVTSDADGDVVSTFLVWLVDGVVVAGETEATYTPDDQVPGASVACRVTPSDNDVAGTPITSAAVTLTNAAPSVNSVVLSPAGADTTVDLICSVAGGADPDGDSVEVHISWTIDGNVVAGATSSTLDASLTSKNNVIVCTGSPWDGFMYGTPLASSAVTIINTPPAAPVVSISPSPSGTMHDLKCGIDSDSADPDNDPIQYEFAWYADDVPQPEFLSDTIPAEETNECVTWRCEVIPHDGTESGPMASASLQVQLGGTPRYGVYAYQQGGQIRFKNMTGFGVGQGNWTFELWVMAPTSSGHGALYFSQAGSPGSVNFVYDTTLGAVVTTLINPGSVFANPDAVLQSTTIAGGDWHHVAVVHQNGQVTLYTDGVAKQSVAMTPNLQESKRMTFGRPDGSPLNAATNVRVGPTRFSQIARYTSTFMPATLWAVDVNTVAQYYSEEALTGLTTKDEAGGDNKGETGQAILSYSNAAGSDSYADCSDYLVAN